MKRHLDWSILAMALFAVGGVACSDKSTVPANANTYHLVCGECSHVWVIEREQARTYPADPNGAGFKCEKCGKLAAKIGTQCKKCNQWYVAASRGMPCPHCAKGNVHR